MKVEVDLLVPENCVWWSALVIYLLFSWLVIGPVISRRCWRRVLAERQKKNFYHTYEIVGAESIWLWSPLYWPIALVIVLVWAVFRKPLNWLIYGSESKNTN